MSSFVIPVADIDEFGKDYEFSVEPTWVDEALSDLELAADVERGPGALSLHVQKNGQDLLVTGRLRAALTAPCVRCLEPASVAIDTSLLALLSPATSEKGAPALLELEAEDLDRGTYSGENLVLDSLVREYLLVECPMQPVCQQDCKGLEVPAHIRPPADFGEKEQGIDPRLSPLLKLKDQVLPKKE